MNFIIRATLILQFFKLFNLRNLEIFLNNRLRLGRKKQEFGKDLKLRPIRRMPSKQSL